MTAALQRKVNTQKASADAKKAAAAQAGSLSSRVATGIAAASQAEGSRGRTGRSRSRGRPSPSPAPSTGRARSTSSGPPRDKAKEKEYYQFVSKKFEPLISSGDAVRGTGSWDQTLRNYKNPKVEDTPPTADETGRPLSEHERIEFLVNKQEAQRQAQGFRPSDPTPNPKVGFNVYQHPIELGYDKDIVFDRFGSSGQRSTAQKFWRVGGDHSSVYDLIYYDRRNAKYRRNDPAWDTERNDPNVEPKELDDLHCDLRLPNRDIIRYAAHIRDVGKFIESTRSIPRAVSQGYNVIRITPKGILLAM